MGCLASIPLEGGIRRRSSYFGEVAVFVPGFRIPKSLNFSQPLATHELLSSAGERLSALRSRASVMAGQELPTTSKSKKTATQHGGSTLEDLQQALEEYLPIVIGLVKEGSKLENMVVFEWINQEDEEEETAMSNAWYEVLSVLHLMAMLTLSHANLLLLAKTTAEASLPKAVEESRRISVDTFLKAAGYLDFALRYVIPKMPRDVRRALPMDLREEVLRALCMQALGQGAYIQLGMAIDSSKATLAVKRRLACEMVKYWQQAQESIMDLTFSCGIGIKHKLFVKWKFYEAKALAYYFHGLILHEANTEKAHTMAVASLEASEEFLRKSKRTSEEFSTTPPHSRSPLWGAAKYLTEKFHSNDSSKLKGNSDLYNHDKIVEAAPPLPDFPVALKPDEYILPSAETSWDLIDNRVEDQATDSKT